MINTVVAAPERTVVTESRDLLHWRVELHGVVGIVTASRVPFASRVPIVLAGYPVPDPRSEVDVAISIERGERRGLWNVGGGSRRFRGLDLESAARKAEWCFADEALRRLERYIHVHAALVGTGVRSAAVVGRSGMGKSTTSVGLAQVGLSLFADDVALIDSETLRPVAFPRPIKLDTASRRMLRPLGVRVSAESRMGESIDRTVLPGMVSPEIAGPPVEIVIFFAETRAARPAVRRLTAAEALLRFVRQSITESVTAAGPTPRGLALINAVRCYELTAGSLVDTIEAVVGLLETG